jgi:hypothetical protein
MTEQKVCETLIELFQIYTDMETRKILLQLLDCIDED